MSTAKRWPVRGSFAGILRLTPHSRGQAGDGRERALANHVLATTPPGDLDAVVAAMDQFAYQEAFLRNVGDEKGVILDAALHAAQPTRLLELGTYCGYSALRIAGAMPPDAHLCSIERGAANAKIATRLWENAGVADRVSVLVGTPGDDGTTSRRLETEHGFTPASLDFVFIDHDKDEYLPDLRRILDRDWLHPGSIVVADNIENPGAPAYYTYMRHQEGRSWHTTERHTHVEYQPLLPDLILESTYLGTTR